MRSLILAAAVLTPLTASAADATYPTLMQSISEVEAIIADGRCGYAQAQALLVSDAVESVVNTIRVGLDVAEDQRGQSAYRALSTRNVALLVMAGECEVNGRSAINAVDVFKRALAIMPTDSPYRERARDGLWKALGLP